MRQTLYPEEDALSAHSPLRTHPLQTFSPAHTSATHNLPLHSPSDAPLRPALFCVALLCPWMYLGCTAGAGVAPEDICLHLLQELLDATDSSIGFIASATYDGLDPRFKVHQYYTVLYCTVVRY